MVRQVENLRKGMDSLIMNVKNVDALDAALDKLAIRHKEREMPADYFQVKKYPLVLVYLISYDKCLI